MSLIDLGTLDVGVGMLHIRIKLGTFKFTVKTASNALHNPFYLATIVNNAALDHVCQAFLASRGPIDL
ncbi:MAG: hypothetical protein ACTSUE_04565 [Promethearchaeota archaeon]